MALELVQSTAFVDGVQHYLSFHDEKKVHAYILDGYGVPGPSTYCKGGFPTGEALIGWMIKEGAKYAVLMVLRLMRDKKRKFTLTLLEEIYKRCKNKHKGTAQKAASCGTIVHSFAELSETGRREEALALLASHKENALYERIANGCRKFDEWRASNSDTNISTEIIVGYICKWDHSQGNDKCQCFAGKFDRLAYRPNVGWVLSDFKTSSGIFVDQKIQLAAYVIAIRYWLGIEVDAIEVLRFGKEDGDFEVETITDKVTIKEYEEQALRCRATYKFKLKYDKRKWPVKKGIPKLPRKNAKKVAKTFKKLKEQGE